MSIAARLTKLAIASSFTAASTASSHGAAASELLNRSAKPERNAGIPWYLWCGVVGVTSMEVGGLWDLSWHRSIGRDTFWTPAHIAIQFGGILAALVCAALVFTCTFGRRQSGDNSDWDHRISNNGGAASVQIFGLRGPFGAFLCAWGGVAMASSVPFDNWWHAAYGLDTVIVSPPHALLLTGVLTVEMGVLLLTLAAMNRAETTGSGDFKALERLFFYVGGVMLTSLMFCAIQYINNAFLHASRPYKAVSVFGALGISLIAQAHRHRWAGTIVASLYMLVIIATIQILPLFPATPKLGPVFYPVTHMVPSAFPALLVFPALALDLLWRHTRGWRPLPLALLSGTVFMLLLLAVEWPFADFLMSKWADNRFFGTIYHEYSAQAATTARGFQVIEPLRHFVEGMVEATLFSCFGIWIGVHSGRWLRGVRR